MTSSDYPADSGAVQPPVTITVGADGPYMVKGAVEIRNAAGELVTSVERAALCRCGGSENKPFCDGTHKRIGFSDPGPAAAQA